MPQTASAITAEAITTLLTATNQSTNLNIGSTIRSILDGVGAEGALIEQEITDQVQQAILNVAYQIWQVTPNPAIASIYQLTFTNTTASPVTIAQETIAMIASSSLLWSTQTPVTIPAQTGGISGTVTVNAVCNAVGSQTNVPAGSIILLNNPILGISVTNTSADAIVFGSDAETQSQTQARLANKKTSLHKGDANAIEVGALSAYLSDSSGNIIEQIAKAKAVDLPSGNAMVYVVNQTNGLSSTLKTQTQQVVNGYTDSTGKKIIGSKAAGVSATVTQVILNSVNTNASILPLPGYVFSNILPQVQTTIANFFKGLDVEQSLSLGSYILALRSTPGVGDVSVTVPTLSLTGVPSVVNPTVAPTLTAVAGSTSLLAGIFTVGYTFTTSWGETLISPTATVTITAGQAIQVSAITLPFGASGVNYYLSIAAGSSTVTYDVSGTGAQINLMVLPVSGASIIPPINTALIHGNLYIPGTITIIAMAV